MIASAACSIFANGLAKKRGLSNERFKLTTAGEKPCLLSPCWHFVLAMEITKGLLLKCEFTKEKGGTFKRWPLEIRMENNKVETVWIYGQYCPGVDLPDFNRLKSLWFGLKGKRLKPAD